MWPKPLRLPNQHFTETSMKNSRNLFLAGYFTCLWLCQPLFSQTSSFPLLFQQREFDFGTIGERGGPVYHHFLFVNTGTDTVWIMDAKAACHCTTGEFPKQGIPPKGTGTIKLTYNPKDRPWEFETGLTILLKKHTKTIELKAKGKALGGLETARFAPLEFTQKFLYNEKSIEESEADFKQFVEKLVPLLEVHKDVKVQIESSASHVPTKSFSTNEELTRQRAKDARIKMVEIFSLFQADLDRLMFMEDITLVQGPPYSSDYKKQMAKYLPFQYVKIKVF